MSVAEILTTIAIVMVVLVMLVALGLAHGV
jgi:hypothetical protein